MELLLFMGGPPSCADSNTHGSAAPLKPVLPRRNQRQSERNRVGSRTQLNLGSEIRGEFPAMKFSLRLLLVFPQRIVRNSRVCALCDHASTRRAPPTAPI